MTAMAKSAARMHYLRVEPKILGKGFIWNCICGEAAGEGPSEEACEVSYSRHLVKERFRVTGRLY